LTNDKNIIDTSSLTFKKWSEPVLAYMNEENKTLLEFLGLFDEAVVPPTCKSSADILQFLVETKLAMRTADKDMIVMLHEFEYLLNGEIKKLQSSLVVKGEDSMHTAMAKTVGLPLGIAAKIILNGTLTLTGLHIPILKEIYEPVLEELEHEHIVFNETSS
jgi:saccharopine dehydrogenase-like NADP-dependent oxidoreductase